jgi:hypothetical protein
MRIASAGLVLVMLLPLVGCVHETTVFHSPTGATYFKESSTEATATSLAGTPATSPTPADEPVPSR